MITDIQIHLDRSVDFTLDLNGRHIECQLSWEFEYITEDYKYLIYYSGANCFEIAGEIEIDYTLTHDQIDEVMNLVNDEIYFEPHSYED